MRFGDLGAPELILIVLALVLVFGASKLGELGGQLGKSVREFKKATAADAAPAPAAVDDPTRPVVTAVPSTGAAVPAPPTPALADYRPDRVPTSPD